MEDNNMEFLKKITVALFHAVIIGASVWNIADSLNELFKMQKGDD